MSSNCRHPTCMDAPTCRREVKPKKVYQLKRTPLKKVYKPIARHSKNELPDLIETLDRLVSEYVRRNNADKKGFASCFTCDIRRHWKDLQAGHFVPRGCMFLRFYVDWNIRVQCTYCNCHLYGNLSEFAKRLDKDKEGIANELLRQSKFIHKWSREDLTDMIDNYKSLLTKLNNHETSKQTKT